MPVPTLLERGKLTHAGKAISDEIPVRYIVSWLRRRMPENGWRGGALADRVLAVRAETGSGKSTVLPVEVFRLLRPASAPRTQVYRGPGVICTQPRVLTAVDLAKKVSAARRFGDVIRQLNPDMYLGETVGYQTGPVSNRAPAGLMYATIGVLAAQLRSQTDTEIMERYRFVLIDEAHERSLPSDAALMLLRDFYARNVGNERLPFLLLTSATFDPGHYADYFGLDAANIMEVTGRAYHIERHWPAQGTNSYPVAAAQRVLEIHEAGAADPPERADILIFMPGAAETAAVAEELERLAPDAPLLLLTLNRDTVASQSADFALAFEDPARLPPVRNLRPAPTGQRPARRVIIATVVAETGLTFDTLRYVIDAGWSRGREVYQPWGVEGVTTRPAPRTRVTQRAGRAGRLFDGDLHPLYTESVFASLDADQPPDVITVGGAEIHLALVAQQALQKRRLGQVPDFRLEDMTLLDPPPPEALLAANGAAAVLGFVAPDTAAGYGLTPMGQLGATFTRTPMEGVRTLLAGLVWGTAASDLATAVAMFGVPAADLAAKRRNPGPYLALRHAMPPFLAQRFIGGAAGDPITEVEAAYYRARLVMADDFAEVVLIFDAFLNQFDRGFAAAVEWCAAAELNFEALVALAQRREAILEELILAGLDPVRGASRRLAVLPIAEFTEGLRAFKRCLYDGLRARLLRADGAGYVTLQGLRVKAPELLTDALASRLRELGVTSEPWRPIWLVTDQVRLGPAPRRESDVAPPLLYTMSANLVCVLDGFVNPDLAFGSPREFPLAAQIADGSKTGEAKNNASFGAAQGRLDTYGRVARAALAARGNEPRAPVCYLADPQLQALFTPLQSQALVYRAYRSSESFAGDPGMSSANASAPPAGSSSVSPAGSSPAGSSPAGSSPAGSSPAGSPPAASS